MEVEVSLLKKELSLINKYINDLKYKNRFFIDKELIEKFEVIISDFCYNIEVGKKLYRGRILPQGKLEPYGLNEHGIPPTTVSSNGRVNPYGINYLYLAENIETVIAELRPNHGSWISLATFTVESEINAVVLTDEVVHDSQEIAVLVTLLEHYLTMPVKSNDSKLDYLPMQYFAEFCKNKGVKGIKYLSSVRNNYQNKNFNIALFNESYVKCIDTSMIKVKEIVYDYRIHKPSVK